MNFNHNELNQLMQKKQQIVQKALQFTQQGNFRQAAFMFKIESGLNIEIQKLFEPHIEDITEEPEVKSDDIDTDETMFEDAKDDLEQDL
jgi:hypothetical protein